MHNIAVDCVVIFEQPGAGERRSNVTLFQANFQAFGNSFGTKCANIRNLFSYFIFQQMESELERFHKQNTSLELNITELRLKLKATDKEMHSQRQRVNNINVTDRHCSLSLSFSFLCFCFTSLLFMAVLILYLRSVYFDLYRPSFCLR